MPRTITLAALAALVASSAIAQQIADGDTLKLAGVTYRLHGIDAAELSQVCPDGWPAGRLAASHLQALIAGRSVICEETANDRYGRSVARCFVGGVDLGRKMVRDGYALAFVRYSSDYVPEERAAQAERLGLHQHDCPPAWEWRASKRR